MRKKRESFCSMSTASFLNPATGPFKRLDNTAWYLKITKQKPCYFLNMKTKFQQMPEACFETTAKNRPEINFEDIKKEINEFVEANYVKA